MDPRLETRGSNDLGGAMFKEEHVRVHYYKLISYLIGSPTFFIRRGERKQEREDHSRNVKGFTKLQGKGQDASYIKGALFLC